MTALQAFLKCIHDYNESTGHDKEWERLRDRIMSQKHTAKSLRELDRDVKAFFKSAAPEEDKIKLTGYTESLAILMDAVNNDLIK